MSRKHFSTLVAVTVLVAVLVLLLPDRAGREEAFEPVGLLPELSGQVNEIDWLRVTGPGNEVIATLERRKTEWVVAQAGGYPADWSRLRTLLTDLAEAEIIEPKTANSQYYDRLGVQDIEQPDAGGLQIEFAPDTGLPALIVGKGAEGRDGSYVRKQGDAASFLIDRRFDLPRERKAWMEQTIVDVSDAEVVEVLVEHPDGERIVASKASADDEDFELQGIPEGREIRSAWAVNSLAGNLSSLTLDEVRRDMEIEWSGATRFSLLTADGLRIEADLLRLDAGPAEPTAEADEAEVEEALVGEAGAEPLPQHWLRVTASAASEAAQERAAGINDRVSGWAYKIPQFKYDGMVKRMEDLLQAADSS